jgi:hypothetical protein
MSDLLAANHVIANRVVAKTKCNYRGKLNTIKLYLLTCQNVELLISLDNKIIVPLSSDVVKGLFGWLSTNTDLPKKKRGRRANNQNEEDADDDLDHQHINHEAEILNDDNNGTNNNSFNILIGAVIV